MRLKILWFIPTHGDIALPRHQPRRARRRLRLLQAESRSRPTAWATRACCCPTGRSCEDSWVVASSLIDATRRLKFLVALRPGLMQPVQSARMAATFDRLSGGAPARQPGDRRRCRGARRRRPVPSTHAERYELSARVPDDLARGARAQPRRQVASTSTASICRSRARRCCTRRCSKPYPPVFFGGSSRRGARTRRRASSTPTSPGASRRPRWPTRWPTCARRAARHGRTLSFGIRLHVIVRETEDEAWRRGRRADLASRRRRSSPRRRRSSRRWIRSASAAWPSCTAAASTSTTCARPRGRARTSGPASAWCAAARAPRWWATRAGGGAHPGVRGARPRALHPVGLPASRRGVPLRRAGVPAAAAATCRTPARRQALTGPFGEVVANHTRCRNAASATQGGRGASSQRSAARSAMRHGTAGGCRGWCRSAASCSSGSSRSARAGCRRACCPSPGRWSTAFWSAGRARARLWHHVAVSTGARCRALRSAAALALALGLLTGSLALRRDAARLARCRWCATSRRWR